MVLLLVVSFGCQKPEVTGRPSTLLVNIAPYAYFAERIVGSSLNIQVLIPEEANPHLYEPNPKQAQSVAQAAIWFRLGDPQENKIVKILKAQNPSMQILDLCKGISLLSMQEYDVCEKEGHEHADAKDRHVWLSPRLAIYQVKKMTAALMERFPENRQVYLLNAKELIDDLEALEEEISAILAPFEGEAILASHPAFAYYCRDFRLVQLSVECEGKEPRPKDLAKTLQQAKELHARCVLTQTQYSNKGAELIAKNLNLPVYLVDPYSKNYIENMRAISAMIAQ
jgi:zinc transport system substrate-binding protein